MGLSASQARLLSLTKRLLNNELQSEIISNAKIRLASKADEAKDAYINALNDTKLTYTDFDAYGDKTSLALTYNTLMCYSALKTQSVLKNSHGQVLISAQDYENYMTSSCLYEFLSKYGVFDYEGYEAEQTNYTQQQRILGRRTAAWNAAQRTPEARNYNRYINETLPNYQRSLGQYNSIHNAIEEEYNTRIINLRNERALMYSGSDARFQGWNIEAVEAYLTAEENANITNENALNLYIQEQNNARLMSFNERLLTMQRLNAQNVQAYIDPDTDTAQIIQERLPYYICDFDYSDTDALRATSQTYTNTLGNNLSISYNDNSTDIMVAGSALDTSYLASQSNNFSGIQEFLGSINCLDKDVDYFGIDNFQTDADATIRTYDINNCSYDMNADWAKLLSDNKYTYNSYYDTFIVSGTKTLQEKAIDLAYIASHRNTSQFSDVPADFDTMLEKALKNLNQQIWEEFVAEANPSDDEGIIIAAMINESQGDYIAPLDFDSVRNIRVAYNTTPLDISQEEPDTQSAGNVGEQATAPNNTEGIASTGNDYEGNLVSPIDYTSVIATTDDANAVSLFDRLNFVDISNEESSAYSDAMNTFRSSSEFYEMGGVEEPDIDSYRVLVANADTNIETLVSELEAERDNLLNSLGTLTEPNRPTSFTTIDASSLNSLNADSNTINENYLVNFRSTPLTQADLGDAYRLNADGTITRVADGVCFTVINGAPEEGGSAPVAKMNDKSAIQWYINLWYAIDGQDNPKELRTVCDEDGVFVAHTIENMTKLTQFDENGNPLNPAFAILPDELRNDSNWIQYALQNGIITLTQITTRNNDNKLMWKDIEYSSAAQFNQVTDERMLAKAEAEYENAMRDIEAQDKEYDTKLKKLDTEHSAMKTEYESVKNIIGKNVERSFKSFDA